MRRPLFFSFSLMRRPLSFSFYFFLSYEEASEEFNQPEPEGSGVAVIVKCIQYSAQKSHRFGLNPGIGLNPVFRLNPGFALNPGFRLNLVLEKLNPVAV